LRTVGTALALLGFAQLAGSYALHLMLGAAAGPAAPIARAALQPLLGRVAMPGLAPFAIGAVTIALAHRLRCPRTPHGVADGCAAFLSDDAGHAVNWRPPVRLEPETLRTAPANATYRR
jgi:hypothetical protein